MSKKAKKTSKRNETPAENLARRTKKAEYYLQKVARKEGIDLTELSEDEYNNKLTQIVNKLTGMGILR